MEHGLWHSQPMPPVAVVVAYTVTFLVEQAAAVVAVVVNKVVLALAVLV
jgi:hypothetical protein